jgi:hypothetical protein
MTKEELLAEIRKRGTKQGRHLSLRAFCRGTGIAEKQVLGVHWVTWNEAIAAAGLNPRSFARPRADEATTFEALAQFIQRIGHWPTENELRRERHETPSFPGLKVFLRLKKAEPLSRKLAIHCAERSDLKVAAAVVSDRIESEPAEPLPATAPVRGYVYMMRSGRRYKIGRTNSPSRRHREVRLDMPDPTLLVHSIETDDPAGIEEYWHSRFRAKQVRDTEFFTLDAGDVAAFKRRRYQ